MPILPSKLHISATRHSYFPFHNCFVVSKINFSFHNCFVVIKINVSFQVKMEGFDLLSKESVALQNKQSSTSMEGDAWIISLHEAENLLLVGGARKKVLSILKTIRDRHLDLQVIR